MADELNELTRRRIRDFCKSIKVREGVDRQIADELSAHMEDKVRAYLDGREKLTEEDALLLVEHHFGEPGVVRDLLQTVHNGLPTTSTARRLAAIVCLVSGLAAIEHLIRLALYLGFDHWLSKNVLTHQVLLASDCATLTGSHPHLYPIASNVTVLLPSVLAIAILWRVLRFWQRRINLGTCLWFDSWPAWRIAAFAVLLFVAAESAHLIATPFWAADPSQDFAPQICGCALILMTTAAIWGWWCGRGPRKSIAAAAIGVFGWLGWEVLYQVLMPSTWRRPLFDLKWQWHFAVRSPLDLILNDMKSLFDFQWYFGVHSQTDERYPFDLAQMFALTAAVLLMYYLISRRFRSKVLATPSG